MPTTKLDNPKAITEWCLTNKERARPLGRRLMDLYAKRVTIDTLPSLGTEEDQITRWAVTNQTPAMLLFMKLAPQIKE